MSRCDAQPPMDPGDLGPKHRVFLCHSGAQKGFVEQLNKDLRSADRYPFFDKDRESLLIGENFPIAIFHAIEHCQVGVVFLSEAFFMQSHWPMFEVVKMVECGRRIMPIFLGISPGDLSKEEKVAEWRSKWEAWAKVNGRIDVGKWESALRSFKTSNGLVYNHAVGAVKFREEIVKELCRIVPPFHVWDDSHVQGKSRISKIIEVKISETSISEKGVRVVGLYGVGGIGKTTACKCLCTNLGMEFDGRVCHIEFGDGTSEIDRVREVLKRLTSTNTELLKDKSLDECWSQLKGLLRLNKVVLAIDNVSARSKICEEARKYLRLEYEKGSIVMVTARALGELENLGIKMDNCLAMPELVEEEARELFLHHAEFENELDEEVVMRCISRCYFGKGDGIGSKHYHPLALKVLGSQLVGRHPSEWKSQLEEEDVFNQLREEENQVLSILTASFGTLKHEDQMLFMDVALFDDGGKLRGLKYRGYSLDVATVAKNAKDEALSWYTIFEWLSMVHGVSVDRVKKRLNELKRRSLLEELGDGRGQIGMHDLWREFAVMKAKHEEEDSKWLYEDHVGGSQANAESCMSGGGWKSFRRIWVQEGSINSVNFNECSEVRVLRLKRVFVENGALDLSRLKLLKCLEIDHPDNCPSEMYGEEVKRHEVSGVGQLLSLTILTWFNIDGEFLSVVEEISFLTNLRVLYLSQDIITSSDNSSMSLDLQQLRLLKDVRLYLRNLVIISGLSSKMKDLRILDLGNCDNLRTCVGVGDVTSLEVLLLEQCCKLEELPNLDRLTRLRILDVGGCGSLKALEGLGSLVSLQELYAHKMFGYFLSCMKELPSMSTLVKLEILDLSGCYRLKCIPSLSGLVALQKLGVPGRWLHDLPDCRNLPKLQKVEISGTRYGSDNDSELGCRVSQSVVNLAMLESIATLTIRIVDHELTNLSELTALKSLELSGCGLERLPHLGRDMRLESLRIEFCSKLRGFQDGVRGLRRGPDFQMDLCYDWSLSNLQELTMNCCEAFEKIDLSHFPQLRDLSLWGYTHRDSKSTEFVLHCHAIHVHLDTLRIWGLAIKELPDLSKFPSLQHLMIVECNELTSLAISEPLSTLSHVDLRRCESLHTFPNINLFPRLAHFTFQECGVQLNEHVVQNLEARGIRHDGRGTFRPLPSRDVVLFPVVDLNRCADEEVAVDAPNDLDTALEPCKSSEFIPYDESLSELGRSPIINRALEQQTKKLLAQLGAFFLEHLCSNRGIVIPLLLLLLLLLVPAFIRVPPYALD